MESILAEGEQVFGKIKNKTEIEMERIVAKVLIFCFLLFLRLLDVLESAVLCRWFLNHKAARSRITLESHIYCSLAPAGCYLNQRCQLDNT
jgi:hypothetical protein